MTQTEIKAKIADWESRLKNPSVASVPSAVAKINSEIADLKSKLETEKPKKETVKVLGKEVTKGTKEHEKLVAQKKQFDDLQKSETEPPAKYKVGDILWHDTQHKGEYKKVKILAITGYTGDGHRYDIEFVDNENKGINKFAKSYDDKLTRSEPKKAEPKETKTEVKAETKKDPYNCDDLIKEAKERHAKKQKAAKERKAAPKKSEVTKDKEKIDRVHYIIEKQIENDKLSKGQIKKLIAETKDLLKLLEKALNNL